MRNILIAAAMLGAAQTAMAATDSSGFAAAFNNSATLSLSVENSITISDYLGGRSAPISINGSGTETLTLGGHTLSFAPGWNDNITAGINNLGIVGLVSFGLDGVGARNYTISGASISGGTNGAVIASGQMQNQAAGNANVSIYNTGFSNNAAANGGAVYFVSNNSMGSSPAFKLYSSPNQTFASNSATGNGGAVYFGINNGSANNSFESTGYDYTGNTAGGYGGAIYANILNPNGGTNVINIYNGTFSGNTAAYGGAFALQVNGGAAANSINISGNTFSGNSATYGGAIYNAVGDQYSPYGGSLLFNVNSSFTNNTAQYGGAIYNYLAHGAETIDFNVAGTLSGNKAAADGGAIYNIASNWSGAAENSARVNIQAGTQFINNLAGQRGGALFNNTNGTIDINADAGNNVIFSGNRASVSANNGNGASTLGDDIFNADPTSVINFTGAGNVAMTGGFGGTGTINKLGSGLLYLSGAVDLMNIAAYLGIASSPSDSSGFTGTFNLNNGKAYFDGIMFGGTNNIYGTGNDPSGGAQQTVLFINSNRESIYFNMNVWDKAFVQFMSASPGATTITAPPSANAPGLIFLGSDATMLFMGVPQMDAGGAGTQVIGSNPTSYYLPRDIYNPNGTNYIAFFASDVSFGDNWFNHTTQYQFSGGSTIDLAASSSDYKNYTFSFLDATDDGDPAHYSSFISLKVAGDVGGNIVSKDTLTLQGGVNTSISLGNIYINDKLAMLNDQSTQVLYGGILSFDSAAAARYVVSNGNVYKITASGSDLLFGLEAGATGGSGGSNPDMNDAVTGNVTVDDGAGGSDTIANIDPCASVGYQVSGATGNNGAALNACSNVSIYGDDPDDTSNNVISGGTGGAFDITGDDSNLNLSDVIVDNVSNTGDGGVINIDNGSSSTNVSNVDATNNNSDGSGGVINIGTNGGDVSVGDSDFSDNTAAGNGGAINNDGGNLVISGGGFDNNTATTGNGGAINNGAGSGDITIGGGTTFTDNTAGDQGGAIYNDGTLNIVTGGGDMIFSGNTAANGGDDIYNGTDQSVINISGDGNVVINGGIGGTGQINKSGDGTLELADGSKNGDFDGSFAQSGGTTDVGGDFFGGSSVIGGGTIIWDGPNAKKDDTATLVVTDGANVVIRDGGDLILNNSNDNISDGANIYVDSNSTLDVDGGTATINDRDVILGNLTMEDGNVIFDGTPGVLANYDQTGGTATITGGGTLTLGPDIVISGGNVKLDNGTLSSINNKIDDINIAGDLIVNGTGYIKIDINARDETSDSFTFANANGPGNLVISDVNFIGKAPTEDQIFFNVINAGTYDPALTFGSTGETLRTPILDYRLDSVGNGRYRLGRSGYNPTIFRGQAADILAFSTQLEIVGAIEQHLFGDSTDPRSDGFMSFQAREEVGGAWAKAFGMTGRIKPGMGVNMSTSSYGVVGGIDFAPMRRTNYGTRFTPSLVLAATGGRSEYSGATISQTAAQIGAGGTFAYGTAMQFSLVGFMGFADDEMSVKGANDAAGGMFYGASAKAAYSLNMGGWAIVPNVRGTWFAAAERKWHSDYGDIDITAKPFAGHSIAPGVDFIIDNDQWDFYAGAAWSMNGGGAEGLAESVALPGIAMPSFAELYAGARYQKTEVLSLDGRLTGRAGADTSAIGIRIGANWKF